jgi:hypothetical protein
VEALPRRCRGQDAVHTAADAYLPKLKDQDPEATSAYVMRTPFYNATWRTIAGLVGMLFRKPPKHRMPEAMKEMLDDVTMDGVPMQVFAQDGERRSIEGRPARHPRRLSDRQRRRLTQADVKKQNLRPMMRCTTPSDHQLEDRARQQRHVLTQVVLKEGNVGRQR